MRSGPKSNRKRLGCGHRGRGFIGLPGRFFAAIPILLAASSDALAHDNSSHRNADGAGPERAQVSLEDLPLVDVGGRELAFGSEVVGDRIVAVNFIYTSCTTICPVMSSIFAAVQDDLGGSLGTEVRLVSLSIDPATDTPPRLARYSQNFDAGPGWIFLTGDRLGMARVLAGLGAYTPDFEDHPSMVLIGDAREAVWHRIYGYPSPDEIVTAIRHLVAARQNRSDE